MCRADRTVLRNVARRIRTARCYRNRFNREMGNGTPKLSLKWYYKDAIALIKKWSQA